MIGEKTMKKNKGIILALLVATILSSCGSDESTTDQTEDNVAVEATIEPTEEANTADSEATSDTEVADEEPATEEPVTEEPTTEETDVQFSIGKWNENTFENEWLNMKFEVPADWIIATDEEIAALMGVGAEIVSESQDMDSEAYASIAELTTSYGFMASSSTGMPSAQLMYENLLLTLGASDMTEEEYAQILIDNLTQVEDYGYEVLNQGTIDLGGKPFYFIEMSVMDGQANQNYYMAKQDNYMSSIIFTYDEASKSSKDEFINAISAIN